MDFSKRYWLGSIEQYYPSGFLGDVVETVDSLDAAKKWVTWPDDEDYIGNPNYFAWDNREFKYIKAVPD